MAASRPAGRDWARHPRIRLAAARLLQGSVVAYPTEAVWGLGCNPLDADAVARILALKGRPVSKGVILVAASFEQLQPFMGHLTADQAARVGADSDRPVTWVVPAGRLCPGWITGGRDTLAVRVTRHPVAAGLCRAVGGAVVSTSANPQGKPPARSGLAVRRYFGDGVDCLTPGRVGAAARPSEIRDINSGEILRPGDQS